MIRIGWVEFDTSHVQAFTQRLNHVDVPESEWVEGAKIVAGYPAELIGKVDAVMVESQQGSKHLAHARLFLEAGLPVFVDKPFVNALADADVMIALAQKKGVPLMSCLSLRYAPTIQAARAKQSVLGQLLSADVWTPASLHEGNPGMLHYGIHGVEMLYALIGAGCQSVSMVFTEQSEVASASGIWPSGQVGTVRGIRAGHGGMGFVAHYEKGQASFFVEGAAFYRELLKQIVAMFQSGEPSIPYAEMREIVAFIVAAEDSRKAGGALVHLRGVES